MPRKEEVVVKKKKGKNTADEEVPQTKLDLTIRDKKAGDKKKGGPGDAGSKGSKSKAAAEKPEEPKKPSKAAKARGKPVDEPADDGDYLGDMDLPPSSSSEDEEEENARRQPLYTAEDKRQEELKVKVTERERRKISDKDRKQTEKAHLAKLAALEDDDNVFDVAFEQQGEAADSTQSTTDIKVQNLTMRAKGKILLENTLLAITGGRRYGLIGPNGMGKSTLLRMLARRQIPVPENLDVLLVEQEVVADNRTALEAVVAADVELMKLRAEEAELTARMNDASLDEGAAEPSSDQRADDEADRLTAVYDRMQEIGASSAEARASKILHGLGFTDVMRQRATRLFSGGWRMRISLARALYIQPSVLLLDEPTNHLDLRAVLWLEEYLCRWKKTLVVVSHDRDFLNMVTTDIIHLHDQRLHGYRGNFAQFEDMYEQKRKEVNKVADKFEKQIKAAKKSGSKATQDKVAKSAKEAVKRKGKGGPSYADDTAPTAEAPRRWNDYTVHFQFPDPSDVGNSLIQLIDVDFQYPGREDFGLKVPDPSHVGNSLIQLIDVDFQYPGREDFGLKDLNYGIDMGSRIAIVGPNGAGKTTLMNLLAGDLLPTSGDFRKGRTLRIGRYAQHFVDALQMDENPVEYLLNKYPTLGLKPEQMRAMLGRFGLSGHHHLQPILKLSGGQKARVVFTAIALGEPHILLLDEPTNHLDMQSIDALAEALEEFEGGVICISHNTQLLSRVCDDAERAEVWLVEDGKVMEYDGMFEDYKDELLAEITAELEED